MIIWRMPIACWVPKATNIHTPDVYYPLLFHCNNGCTTSPQCYVTRTLQPVLLLSVGSLEDVRIRRGNSDGRAFVRVPIDACNNITCYTTCHVSAGICVSVMMVDTLTTVCEYKTFVLFFRVLPNLQGIQYYVCVKLRKYKPK